MGGETPPQKKGGWKCIARCDAKNTSLCATFGETFTEEMSCLRLYSIA